MADSKDLLLFGLAEERYAVPLTRVREIVGLPPITRLPNAPEALRGVINLRGHVVPVVDLRQQFGLQSIPYHKFTVVIVVEAIGAAIGLIVDSVIDVLSLQSEQIEPPPANITLKAKLDFVSGLARHSEGSLVLLDVDRMLTDEQTGVLRERMLA
jgi:purine-binding chemotaxis protein CheW